MRIQGSPGVPTGDQGEPGALLHPGLFPKVLASSLHAQCTRPQPPNLLPEGTQPKNLSLIKNHAQTRQPFKQAGTRLLNSKEPENTS